MSIIKRITLGAMLLVLTILGTRIPALFSIPTADFIRISLGPAFIILSSLLLGPLFGAVVGAGSDLLGVLVFPTTLGAIGTINPFITIMYGLLGVLPWLLRLITKHISKIFNKGILLSIVLSGFWVFVLVFLFTHNSFSLFGGKVYELTISLKIILLAVSLVLFAGLIVAIYFINKSFIKKGSNINVYEINFICLVCEILLMLIMGSIVKSFFYEIDFIFIFAVQAILLFINIPLNTLLVSYMLHLYNRFSVARF